MITLVRLENFKAFKALSLPCAPLTILSGLNGTGKSSVLQSLLLLRQSMQARALLEDPPRLELNGPLVEIGNIEDALHEDADSDALKFGLAFSGNVTDWEMTFQAHPDLGIRGDHLAASTGASEERVRSIPEPPFGGDLLYVNAERIGPRKSYSRSESMARQGELGARGEFVMNYLSEQRDALARNDPRSTLDDGGRLLAIINRWLAVVSPGAQLKIGDRIVQADMLVAGFSFDRRKDIATRSFRPTNVGFGLSYTLPVLTALLAKPGSLCVIENPEAHLHPRGQTRLAELFAQAACAGVQVIAETHSDHFLDGVRIAVREGQLRPNQVALHYFERDGSHTRVTSPELQEDGRLSHWPEGFFDQHEDNLARLLAPKD